MWGWATIAGALVLLFLAEWAGQQAPELRTEAAAAAMPADAARPAALARNLALYHQGAVEAAGRTGTPRTITDGEVLALLPPHVRKAGNWRSRLDAAGMVTTIDADDATGRIRIVAGSLASHLAAEAGYSVTAGLALHDRLQPTRTDPAALDTGGDGPLQLGIDQRRRATRARPATEPADPNDANR